MDKMLRLILEDLAQRIGVSVEAVEESLAYFNRTRDIDGAMNMLENAGARKKEQASEPALEEVLNRSERWEVVTDPALLKCISERMVPLNEEYLGITSKGRLKQQELNALKMQASALRESMNEVINDMKIIAQRGPQAGIVSVDDDRTGFVHNRRDGKTYLLGPIKAGYENESRLASEEKHDDKRTTIDRLYDGTAAEPRDPEEPRASEKRDGDGELHCGLYL